MTIENYLENRWSPRAFSETEIDPELLKQIFKAAGRAPSCFNEQPWRYIIGQKGDNSYDKLFSCLNEWNQAWTKTAPALAIGVVKKNFTKNNKPNDYAEHDLGASSAHLSMQAFEYEIFVHQMAGFDADKARSVFSIPEGFQAVTALALGYIGDKNQLPEDMRKQENGPSVRKSLSDTVFKETWEEKAF